MNQYAPYLTEDDDEYGSPLDASSSSVPLPSSSSYTPSGVVNIMGGRLMITETAGILNYALASATTTIDLGLTLTADDLIYLNLEGQEEIIKIGSLSAGTEYNCTRAYAGTTAKDWINGSPWALICNETTMDKDVIQLGIIDGKPILIFNIPETGTDFLNTDTKTMLAAGNLNGRYGYVSDIFAVALGDASGSHIKLDSTNGIQIKNGSTTYLELDTLGNMELQGDLTLNGGDIVTDELTIANGQLVWNGNTVAGPQLEFNHPSYPDRQTYIDVDNSVGSNNLTVTVTDTDPAYTSEIHLQATNDTATSSIDLESGQVNINPAEKTVITKDLEISGGGDLIITDGTTRWITNQDGITLIQPKASTSGSPYLFKITGPAHTTLAASTEAPDIDFNLNRTVQFSAGAITTQRAMVIRRPTYSAVGASTITTASTLAITDAPQAGTNVTITEAYALNIENGAMKVAGNFVQGSSGLTRTGGSSFPSSPASGDRFFRTDRGTEYYYDGSDWLSTAEYPVSGGVTYSNMGGGYSANNNLTSMAVRSDQAYKITRVALRVRVDTTNDATHNWTIRLRKMSSAGALTDIYSYTTSGIAASTLTPVNSTSMSSQPSTSDLLIRWEILKNNTPGNLLVDVAAWYRLVG